MRWLVNMWAKYIYHINYPNEVSHSGSFILVMALKIMMGLQWHIVMVQLKVNASTKGQKNGYNLVELRCWNMHQIALNKRCRTLNKRCRNDTWGYLRLKFHKSCFQWLDHPISSNTVLWDHDVYRMKPCPSWFHWGPSSAQSFETKLFLGTPWRREQHGTPRNFQN